MFEMQLIEHCSLLVNVWGTITHCVLKLFALNKKYCIKNSVCDTCLLIHEDNSLTSAKPSVTAACRIYIIETDCKASAYLPVGRKQTNVDDV